MNVSYTKDKLNNSLQHVLKLAGNVAIAECGFVSAKWVQVKDTRRCRCCHCNIHKGSLALTASVRNEYGYLVRTYMCDRCSNAEIHRLLKESQEIEDSTEQYINIDFD